MRWNGKQLPLTDWNAWLGIGTVALAIAALIGLVLDSYRRNARASFAEGQQLAELQGQSEKLGSINKALTDFTEAVKREHERIHGRIDDTNRHVNEQEVRVVRLEARRRGN